MPKANRQKIKLLEIMELLRQQSDEEHPLLTSQIVKALNNLGITCDRRTLYLDIALLNEYGFEGQTCLACFQRLFLQVPHRVPHFTIKFIAYMIQYNHTSVQTNKKQGNSDLQSSLLFYHLICAIFSITSLYILGCMIWSVCIKSSNTCHTLSEEQPDTAFKNSVSP